MSDPLETYVKEKLRECDLTKERRKKVKELFLKYAGKYQRKYRKDATIFICTYMVYREEKESITLAGICKILDFPKEVIQDAIKLAKTEKWCEIEEVDTKTVVKSIIDKLSLDCLKEEMVLDYFNKINLYTDLARSTRPHTLICCIIYYIISKHQKFDKIFFTDTVEISVPRLDTIIKQIRPVFEK